METPLPLKSKRLTPLPTIPPAVAIPICLGVTVAIPLTTDTPIPLVKFAVSA